METKNNPQNLKVRFDNLDPESEYYCVCPECERPFMSERLGRKFCSRKHANDYNNRLKRENKGLERKLTNSVLKDNLKIIQSISNPPNIHTTKNRVETQLLLQEKPEEQISPKSSEEHDMKKKNNQMLADLLGVKQEVSVEWEYMIKSGFNFRAYDSIEPLRGCNLNKINYGNHSIIWITPDKVFITLQKHLLFTTQN